MASFFQIFLCWMLLLCNQLLCPFFVQGFSTAKTTKWSSLSAERQDLRRQTTRNNNPRTSTQLALKKFKGDDDEERKVIEETRLKVLTSRRSQIRWTLRNAESLRTFRINNGWVPEIDPETGKPKASDGKLAVSLTAVVVAVGAVTLRIGGRAALISAVGLDFMSDNPELKQNLDQILSVADSTSPLIKGALFAGAWTLVKVSCIDAAGIALALSSGILFGGVIQGAVASAAAATFGSSVAFGLAKLDTPVRQKALELVDEYPSLRGIEKVVAQDGLKAILTLRLAPILPIPIGMYNYVYGVTNVPLWDFCGGIFLGSLKPYLLDSYLGYFGKELVDGTAAAGTGLQDVILLVALGVSVLIGVFASQLASETYDSILEEVEAEKKASQSDNPDLVNDGVQREFLGFQFPDWAVSFQQTMKEAENSILDLIDTELEAQVWNYTETDSTTGALVVPANLDPAQLATSPEVSEANEGIDFGFGFCESLNLSPQLFRLFLRTADPLYTGIEDDEEFQERTQRRQSPVVVVSDGDVQVQRATLLARAEWLKYAATERIKLLDEQLE